MFWSKKKDSEGGLLKELVRVLKNGLNIHIHVDNVNVTGTLHVKQERMDSLEQGKAQEFNITRETDRSESKSEQRSEPTAIPDFSKLSIPEVKFGEEKE
jgi:hypothetical protein